MKEIKEFIEAVENRLPINLTLSYMFALPEYQALKASISLVSEDKSYPCKCEEPDRRGELLNDTYCWTCGRDLSQQPADTQDNGWEFEDYGGYGVIKPKQDNDGWIECETVKNITLEPHQKVDVRTSNGKVISISAAGYSWNLKGLVLPWAAIAYRIIEEPNKQCVCKNTKAGGVIEITDMFNLRCVKCGDRVELPKKQTLLEYVLERYGSPKGNVTNMNADCVIKLISEYLEMKNN